MSQPPKHRQVTDDDLHEELFRAIEDRDVEIVHRLIERGADVEARNGSLGSPIEYALEVGNAEILRRLLDAGADPENTYPPPLIQAAKTGRLSLAEMLLDAGFEVDRGDDDGDTALYFAAERGYPEIIALLLERGAQVEDGAPLLEAALEGHEEVCALLLPLTDLEYHAEARILLARNRMLRAKESVHPRALELIDAIRHDDTKCVRQLLAEGVPPDAAILRHGELCSAFQLAVALGRREAVELLLAAGAKVDGDPDQPAESPIYLAMMRGDIRLALRLIDAGAEARARVVYGAERGETLVMRAAAVVGPAQPAVEELIRLIRRLVSAGVDLELENAHGRTALVLAARRCVPAITAALLDLGADPEHRDHQGNTAWNHAAFRQAIFDNPEYSEQARRTLKVLERHRPPPEGRREIELMAAAKRGRLKRVKRMLTLGAAIDHQVEDWTALGLAADAGHLEIVRYLLAAGGDPELVDRRQILGSHRHQVLALLG